MNGQLAQAWEDLASRQPVLPNEIQLLVTQVASELLEAATGESPDVPQHEVNFPNGINVILHLPKQITDPEDAANEATKAAFQIMEIRTGQGRTIQAQASYKSPPAIFEASQPKFWTELDGPPRNK